MLIAAPDDRNAALRRMGDKPVPIGGLARPIAAQNGKPLMVGVLAQSGNACVVVPDHGAQMRMSC